MILFFPQYQAGYMPSMIPIGTPMLRDLLSDLPDFVEVPVQQTDAQHLGIEDGIRFRAALRAQLLDAIKIIAEKNPDFILTTGGDCGASTASIAHLNEKYNGKIGVLWIDAHADIHVPSTSPSGNYHGMLMRHLMGDDAFKIKPKLALRARQIAYLGLRDTEIEEERVMDDYCIPHYTTAQILTNNAPLDNVIEHFKESGITHLLLHVDTDVMDPSVFPHVHVPEPDGLPLDRLIEILKYLRAQMPLAGCCLTEYAPREAGAGLDIMKRIYTEGLGLALTT
jgi:arginase